MRDFEKRTGVKVMSLFVTYSKRFLTRYVVDVVIGSERELVRAILDTACSTTLIPIRLAKAHGKKLNTLVKGKEHPCAMFFRSFDQSPVYPSALMAEDSID